MLAFSSLIFRVNLDFGIFQDVVTKLDEYVRRDDGMFSWRELSSDVGDGYTAWVVNMTSQRWYTGKQWLI